MKKEKIFIWLYRVFSFFVPGGIALYTFLIEKLLDNSVSITTKLGISGLFVLVLMVVIAIFFLGKFFKKKISELNDKILISTDLAEKEKLIAKRKKYDARQEIFHNCCFIAPFLIGYFLMILAEKKCIEIRGTLFFVSLSMAIGLGFNGVSQWLYSHEKKQKHGEENIKDFEERNK